MAKVHTTNKNKHINNNWEMFNEIERESKVNRNLLTKTVTKKQKKRVVSLSKFT